MFTSSAIILTLNLQSVKTSSLTPAVLSPLCCWWSSDALIIFKNGYAFRKHFVPAKGLCSWHCIISKGLLKFSVFYGGIVTEFNTKKDGIPLRNVPCFHFYDKIHKHLLTCHAHTSHWGIAMPCHCKWGWKMDQGQMLSLLAGCSIASTARRILYRVGHKDLPHFEEV